MLTKNVRQINASISMYDWASSYLPAFRRSVVEGGAQAVMCR